MLVSLSLEDIAETVASEISAVAAPLLEQIRRLTEEVARLKSAIPAPGITAAEVSAIVDEAIDGLAVPKAADLAREAAHVTLGDRDRLVSEVADVVRTSIEPPKVDLPDIGMMVTEAVTRAIAALPPPEPGRDGADGVSVDVEAVEARIATALARMTEEVQRSIADAQTAREDAIAEIRAEAEITTADIGTALADVQRSVELLVPKAVEKAVSEIPVPVAPTAAEIAEALGDEVRGLVADLARDEAAAAIQALPPPVAGQDGRDGADGRDGKDVDMEAVLARVEAAVAERVAKIPVPKDGVGAAAALIDRDGALVITMTDGTVRNLGPVVGRSIEPAEVRAMVQEAVDAIPRPQDGLGFDDLIVVHDGGRKFALRFARGAEVKEFGFTIPAMIYRGVWKEAEYDEGDVVTFDGSTWHAKQPTSERPGVSADWQMVTRKGRDAKAPVPIARDPNQPVKIG